MTDEHMDKWQKVNWRNEPIGGWFDVGIDGIRVNGWIRR